jgi:hypothetical protein
MVVLPDFFSHLCTLRKLPSVSTPFRVLPVARVVASHRLTEPLR